jgi:hypothetical protein
VLRVRVAGDQRLSKNRNGELVDLASLYSNGIHPDDVRRELCFAEKDYYTYGPALELLLDGARKAGLPM